MPFTGVTAWSRRPSRRLATALALLLAVSCGGEAGESGSCTPPDADGVIGGKYDRVLTVDDAEFTPKILLGQNQARYRVELRNAGTVPHGFRIDCIATPNDDGCPTEACFTDSARLDPVEPGGSGVAEFQLPRVEGLYRFHSTAPDDAQTGQFIVQ